VADTTIKVDSAVRDRLAVLAADRGLTLRDFVEQVAAGIPTQTELDERLERTVAYIRAHLVPDFDADDLEAGERIWRHIAAVQQAGTPGNYPLP
jgi:hypothetical protein